jgi:DNA (cytosine-5)-methyltransferase 1
MKHGSLFSGIGGFDLVAEWMGWENVFHCEWNEFGQKVLKHHFPKAISYHDITKTDFTIHRGQVDVLTGGFPCQPFSMAGKRKGQDDERYLWHEMLRAVQEIEPTYVIAENVFGITNIDGGLVFEQVCADLENEGYEVQPFIIPAAAKNAPHRRDRVWFVAFNPKSKRDTKVRGICKRKDNESIGICEKDRNATYSNGNGLYQCNGNNEIDSSEGGQYAQRDTKHGNGNGDATDTTGERLEGRIGKGAQGGGDGLTDVRQNGNASNADGKRQQKCDSSKITRQKERNTRSNFRIENWQNFPTQSPICGGDDGLPTELDGITFPKWRNESIKAYGNAIVPQVAYEIFKAMTL